MILHLGIVLKPPHPNPPFWVPNGSCIYNLQPAAQVSGLTFQQRKRKRQIWGWDGVYRRGFESSGIISHLLVFFCGWWFQRFFIFIPIWGKIPILTNIFQRGWNHQLVLVFGGKGTIWRSFFVISSHIVAIGVYWFVWGKVECEFKFE